MDTWMQSVTEILYLVGWKFQLFTRGVFFSFFFFKSWSENYLTFKTFWNLKIQLRSSDVDGFLKFRDVHPQNIYLFTFRHLL